MFINKNGYYCRDVCKYLIVTINTINLFHNIFIMDVWNIIILFFVWAIFGSFGWVLISREWNKKWIFSIFFGRSKCTHCKRGLNFSELIPFFSFIFQWAKCKKCNAKLSHFYWVIELLSALVFVATYLLVPYTSEIQLIFWLFINRSLLLLIMFDIKKYELHLPIWIFVTILSVVFWLIYLDLVLFIQSIVTYVAIFIFVYLFSKYYMRLRFNKKEEWFWQWDVYLALTIWALNWFVFYYNDIVVNFHNMADMVVIYVILSCVLWLMYGMINNLFGLWNKKIIPFLPSMIIWFWIMLKFWDFFISILR